MSKDARRFEWPVVGNKAYSVLDGDTVRCELDKGDGWWNKVSVRLEGVNTPEKNRTKDGGLHEKRAGLLVKLVVIRWCSERVAEGKWLYASSTERPKYAGRIVGQFWAEAGDRSRDVLNDYVLEHGLGKPYHGGTREPWTLSELDAIAAKAIELLGSDPLGPLT